MRFSSHIFRFPLVLFFSISLAGIVFGQNEQRSRESSHNLENLFRLPKDVKLNEEQKAKLGALKKEKGVAIVKQLRELQSKHRAVYSPKQKEAQQNAISEARKAGKNPRETQDAVKAAVNFTEDQKTEIEKLRAQQQELQQSLRREINAIIGRTSNRGNRDVRITPTHADVKYGPHERNVLDFWKAKSDKPTPVLVSIHGGGFRGGRKSVSPGILQNCLNEGISVAAITYRFSQHEIAPASFNDSAK